MTRMKRIWRMKRIVEVEDEVVDVDVAEEEDEAEDEVVDVAEDVCLLVVIVMRVKSKRMKSSRMSNGPGIQCVLVQVLKRTERLPDLIWRLSKSILLVDCANGLSRMRILSRNVYIRVGIFRIVGGGYLLWCSLSRVFDQAFWVY
jgi:hypothetical protein